MAREVRFLLWCDPCLGEDVREPGEEITLSLPTVKSNHLQTVTLCERHRKEVYEPLHEALSEFGVKPEAAPKSMPARTSPTSSPAASTSRGRGGFQCPLCVSNLSTRNSLQGHLVRTHNQTLDQIEGDAPYPCGQEDCGIAFKFPQHLALHLKKTHGVDYAETR